MIRYLNILFCSTFYIIFTQIAYAANPFILIENLCANASYSDGDRHYQTFEVWSGECEGNEVSDGIIDIIIRYEESDFASVEVIRINFYKVKGYTQHLGSYDDTNIGYQSQ